MMAQAKSLEKEVVRRDTAPSSAHFVPVVFQLDGINIFLHSFPSSLSSGLRISQHPKISRIKGHRYAALMSRTHPPHSRMEALWCQEFHGNWP